MHSILISLKAKNLTDSYPSETEAKEALADIHQQLKSAGAHVLTKSGNATFAKAEFVSAHVYEETQ